MPQMFLTLNYKYYQDNNIRHIFPSNPKRHNDVIRDNFGMDAALKEVAAWHRK